MDSILEIFGSKTRKEFRLVIGILVAVLAARRGWNSYRSKSGVILPWRQKEWYRRPDAILSYLSVKHMVKLRISSTLMEILLQSTKFLYIGGVNFPILGRTDEVASRDMISYLAFVIGINLCTEGFFWCAYV